MRNHPLVVQKSLVLGIGYDDAEDLIRSQAARDPAAADAVKQIDASRAVEKAAAADLSKDMASRLGLSAEAVVSLVDRLADDPEAETWLLRRVNLTRADGKQPAHDVHPENQ
jgi:hypothetical protein